MRQCWAYDPTLRPTFSKLAKQLETLLESESDYLGLSPDPTSTFLEPAGEKSEVKEGSEVKDMIIGKHQECLEKVSLDSASEVESSNDIKANGIRTEQ